MKPYSLVIWKATSKPPRTLDVISCGRGNSLDGTGDPMAFVLYTLALWLASLACLVRGHDWHYFSLVRAEDG
jgi:hypothetical protein